MRERRRTRAPATVKVPRFDPPTLDRPRAALVVLQGAEADLGTHVWLDGTVTIGRDPLADLPLDDELISRRHCRVGFTDGEYFVEDLASTNGTRLNEAAVLGRLRLRPGDRIHLGGSIVKFAHAEDAELTFHAEMDARAGTDELTGLVVRRRFEAAFARALEVARGSRSALAVLAFDVDGLKQINDAHGHPIGAYTIATVGKIIGEVVRPHGAACRLGGDEFVAFLRALTKPIALAFAESIRTWVGQHRFEMDGVQVQPTLSIGVAAFPEDGVTVGDLQKHADDALYRAKRDGRDRVRT